MASRLNLITLKPRPQCGTSKGTPDSFFCSRPKGHSGPCALVPKVMPTQWQSVEDEGAKLPIATILLAWCGTWLSSPQNFATQEIADAYKRDNGVMAILIIPDPRTCLKK